MNNIAKNKHAITSFLLGEINKKDFDTANSFSWILYSGLSCNSLVYLILTINTLYTLYSIGFHNAMEMYPV